MIGIYDSGSGGLSALSAIRKREKNVDIIYRGDLKNAPYGIKSREELVPLIQRNLERLRSVGCEHILVACMTASSLISHLSLKEQQGVYSIIDCVGESAYSATKNGRVGIVSTSRTMKEGKLREYLVLRGVFVSQSEADALVPLAEAGQTSPNDPLVMDAVVKAVTPHLRAGVDTLVLGCTHFPYFTNAFRLAIGEGVTLVPSGESGATGFLKQISKDVLKGQGHIHFI